MSQSKDGLSMTTSDKLYIGLDVGRTIRGALSRLRKVGAQVAGSAVL